MLANTLSTRHALTDQKRKPARRRLSAAQLAVAKQETCGSHNILRPGGAIPAWEFSYKAPHDAPERDL
jgi:hypothetical protein